MRRFPSGIAEDTAFCNRVQERKRLKTHMEGVKHTVLIAPRRYGKTSLVRQVLKDNQFIYVWVDFLSVTTKQEVEEKVRNAATELLVKLSPELKKITLKAKTFIKSLTPEINLRALGQSLTLHLAADDTIAIDQVLLKLDEYAQTLEKCVVFVCDEFQQISDIENNKSIEALIRHAVERSRKITYIFSGSNRHLLSEMFSHSDRPLYRLCHVMPLERIEKREYHQFLASAAIERWKKEISVEIIEHILAVTECHPFYVNVLCDELWGETKAPDSKAMIDEVWQYYIEGHKSIIISDVVSLALNQKRVLAALAKQPTKEPTGAEFLQRTKLPQSSVKRSLETLLKKDLVYVDKNKDFSVLDPAIKYLIA